MTERHHVKQQCLRTEVRSIAYPADKHNGRPEHTSSYFGCNVFGLAQLEESLPKPVYKEFISQLYGGKTLNKEVADAVAHAVRVWAMDRGTTHYTHWFQPQTDSTAEKHDCFLNLKHIPKGARLEAQPFDSFSGSQLLQAEPDASSFPHGGVRTTFEARGYTVWDMTSPMFIQEGPHGTNILYIPSIFISYTGIALDEKTVLLRSIEAVSRNAVKLLRLLGDAETDRVYVTLGTEQEFFMVERSLYSMRPDLRVTGRTLLGAVPAKHQQLEDHYFARIPTRVLAAISEAELELWKLGVPIKTRHNEVAPSQFEMAPVFEEASVAVDHNLLTMDVLSKVAHRHQLKVLFHEKPFKGVNGSGKHCNWSMLTTSGANLLEPTANPETNYPFLLSLVSILVAIHKHGALLRAGIASASNEHRLGANEAPPSIISAFLGEHLSEVLDAIEAGRPSQPATSTVQSVKVGGRTLDVKVATMPEINRDLTDRNRTSPFAFTGNKFEFRAVGSRQSPSFPVTLLNAAVAAGLAEVTAALEAKKGNKALPSTDDIMAVLKHFITMTKMIRFEGNGYSEEWAKEAAKRGLPNIRSAPEAFNQLLFPSHSEMLKSLEIFTPDELHSRYHVLMEKYAKDILIEAKVLAQMVKTQIFPAVFAYRRKLSTIISAMPKECTPESTVVSALTGMMMNAMGKLAELEKMIGTLSCKMTEPEDCAAVAVSVVPVMNELRAAVDALEGETDNKVWPFPKYQEILY